MSKTIIHTTPPRWVAGTKVRVDYSGGKTAEGVIVEPEPRRGDPGPYRTAWVQVPESPFGGPQDRPFPGDWLTVIVVPDE